MPCNAIISQIRLEIGANISLDFQANSESQSSCITRPSRLITAATEGFSEEKLSRSSSVLWFRQFQSVEMAKK
jgi:hypothetical protein